MAKKIKIIDYPLQDGQSIYNDTIKNKIKADLDTKSNDKQQCVARVISKSDDCVLYINGENEFLLETDKSFLYTEAVALGCFNNDIVWGDM